MEVATTMAGESYIDSSAVIGEGVYIGRFCVIEANAVIGDGVRIEDFSLIQQGARIDTGTKVGTHTKIGSNAVVGKDCSFTAYCEIRSGSKVGDRVSMGSRCTLSAGTTVEDDVIIKYAFVATDTPDLTQNEEKKTCTLKAGSRYGANVTIMPAVTIGANSEIGACSQVRHDVPDDQVWFGCPAKYHRDAK
jgi:UDP-2-acetamido-3-amino-2,3-dideoxy-glucuronate N-acetyltransferase